MAEVLGVFASGVAVVQLATQIISLSERLHRSCGGVKGIPKRISDLLEEIQLLAKTLRQTSMCENDVARECQQFVVKTMVELETFLKELEVKMNPCQGWIKGVVGRMKAVAKDQEIDRLVARLERSKSTFEMAVRAYHMEQMSELVVLLRANGSQESTPLSSQPPVIQTSNLNTAILPERTKILDRVTTTWWCGFGWVQRVVTTRQGCAHSQGRHSVDDNVVKEWRIIPHTWLGMKGFSITPNDRPGPRTYLLTPIYILPEEAPVFQACSAGNLQLVQALITTNKDLICATTFQGWNLLHVAAAHIRPSVCKWLLSEGVRPDVTDYKSGQTPLHIAADRSGVDLTWPSDDGVMRAIDNLARPVDALDTIRVLIEDGHCDPMCQTKPNATRYSQGDQTTLHLYTGPVDGFQYLLKQEQFLIDLSVEDSGGRDIEIAQLLSTSRSSTTLGQLMMRSSHTGPQIANRRYPQLLGRTKLHLVLIKFIEDHYSLHVSQGIEQEPARGIVLDLLNAGADVHDRDKCKYTPLAILLGFTHSTEILSTVLMTWFEVLREARYDVQTYLRDECKLMCAVFLYDNRRHKRSLAIENLTETGGLVFSIKSEYEPVRTQQYAPGGWKDEYDMTEHIDPSQMGDTSLLIGPLEDGFQEIRVYP